MNAFRQRFVALVFLICGCMTLSGAIAGLIPGVRDPVSDAVGGLLNPATENLGVQLRSAAEAFNKGFSTAIREFLDGWDKSIDKVDYLLSQQVLVVFDGLDKQFNSAHQLVNLFYEKAENLNKDLARTGGFLVRYWFVANSTLIKFGSLGLILGIAVAAAMFRRSPDPAPGASEESTKKTSGRFRDLKRQLVAFVTALALGFMALGILHVYIDHALDPVIEQLKRQMKAQDDAAEFQEAGWTAAQLQILDPDGKWDWHVKKYALLAATFKLPVTRVGELAPLLNSLESSASQDQYGFDDLEIVRLTIHAQLGVRSYENSQAFALAANRAMAQYSGAVCGTDAAKRTQKQRLLAPTPIISRARVELERGASPPAERFKAAHKLIAQYVRDCLPESIALHRLRASLIQQMHFDPASGGMTKIDAQLERQLKESNEIVSRIDGAAFALDQFRAYALPSGERATVERLRTLRSQDKNLGLAIDKQPEKKCAMYFANNRDTHYPLWDLPCINPKKNLREVKIIDNPDRVTLVDQQKQVRVNIEAVGRELGSAMRKLVDGELGARARNALTGSYDSLARAMAGEAAKRLVAIRLLIGEFNSLKSLIQPDFQIPPRVSAPVSTPNVAANQNLLQRHRAGCIATQLAMPTHASFLLDGDEFAKVRAEIGETDCPFSRSDYWNRVKANSFVPDFFRPHACYDAKAQLRGIECI